MSGLHGLDDAVDAALLEEPEAGGGVAERSRDEDRVPRPGPVPPDRGLRFAGHRDGDHDLAGLGQVSPDEGHPRFAGRAPEAGHELPEPAFVDVPGQGHPDEGVQGPAAHGGDVAEVDVEGLAAEETRRVVGPPEVLILDEDVGRQEEPLGPSHESGVVADAEEDIGARLAEGAADAGDHPALAEMLQPHRVPP